MMPGREHNRSEAAAKNLLESKLLVNHFRDFPNQ